jgi:hypothetical protein
MTASRSVGTVRLAPLAVPEKMSPAHAAMKGQIFAQSDLTGVSGQHGMPSDISMSLAADAAMSIDMGVAIVGAAMGPRTSPTRARAANRWRMVNRCFTIVRIPHRHAVGKGAAFTITTEA